MILSVTLSKPSSEVQKLLGKDYEKIKIKYENTSNGAGYFMEMFTSKQVFHKHLNEQELEEFIKTHAGTTFKNCVQRTDTSEITILASKKGKITTLKRELKNNQKSAQNETAENLKILPAAQKKKNYLLPENKPVPFLVLLGIMNSEGKVINSKYDKFRQINRFLEFINDILPELTKNQNSQNPKPLQIVDFGCGKSYLTFAVHYFLTEVKHIPCKIEGLDLKQEVIDYCNQITQSLNLNNLIFHTGNIADYSGKETPDLIITLHACDTATDYALQYAVEKNSKAILSVPCCQHQVNQQLKTQKSQIEEAFQPLLKYGLIQEKFSSLVTDALRGQWLEEQGYKVQMLEFIDEEHTPKNLMIRAIKTNNNAEPNKKLPDLATKLGIKPQIYS